MLYASQLMDNGWSFPALTLASMFRTLKHFIGALEGKAQRNSKSMESVVNKAKWTAAQAKKPRNLKNCGKLLSAIARAYPRLG